MQDRIKVLRKLLKMTQAEFGAKIGVTGSSITNYESGARTPGDAVVLSICREFGVSEAWLRYGDGEMYPKRSKNEEIAFFLADIMTDEDESIRKRFILALSHLGEPQWQAIADFCQSLLGEGEPGK